MTGKDKFTVFISVVAMIGLIVVAVIFSIDYANGSL